MKGFIVPFLVGAGVVVLMSVVFSGMKPPSYTDDSSTSRGDCSHVEESLSLTKKKLHETANDIRKREAQIAKREVEVGKREKNNGGTSSSDIATSDCPSVSCPSGGSSAPTTFFPPLRNPLRPQYDFLHHRLFYSFPAKEYPFEEGVIREFSGLKVRYEYDCTRGKDGAGMGYYDACLSRRVKCKEYDRLKKEGATSYIPERPVVDDEYVQWINIMETIQVVPKDSEFVFIELGARWGTWVTRAANVAETLRPDLKFRGFAVESYAPYIPWAKEVLVSNGLESKIEIIENNATPQVVIDIIAKVDRVDMIDVDIQRHELGLIKDEGFWAVAKEKIVRMGIGTHTTAIHSELLAFLRAEGWTVEDGGPYHIIGHCDAKLAAEQYEELITSECASESQYGPVYVRDGEITALNPKFLKK